jgi:DHA1 family bicyclomycin/chloramphenicol resistance-like MFS transporter
VNPSNPASYTRWQHRYLTIVAALLAMVGPFSIDTYLPSFPDIEATFGIDRAQLSQSLAVYLAAFAVSILFWGPLADRVGRRTVILASITLYTLASVGCALANSSDSFMLLRILQGLAASGGFTAGRAMIRDAHDTEAAHRAMSHVILLFALAPAIAPVLGGWLHEQFGWRSVFWFLTAFGVLLLLLTLFIRETLLHEQRQSFHPAEVMRVYLRTLRNGRFLSLVFSLAFSFAGLFIYIAGAPTVIYDFLGMGSNDFGLQFVPMVIGMILGSSASSRLARRWPMPRTIQTGLGLMLVAVTTNLLLSQFAPANVYTVIGPMVLYTFGLAMAMPAITILALDCFPQNRGSATSMQGFMQMMLNAATASLAVPLLHTQWQHFVLGQAGFLLLAILFWLTYRQRMQD